MKAAFVLFIALIGASPLFLVADGPLFHGLLAVAVVILMVIVSFSVPPGEAEHLAIVFRPVAIGLLIPAVWMVIQVLPLSIPGVAHSVWESAADALGRPVTGHITIDVGGTLLALARYCTAAALVFIAAAISVDRLRAEWILFCLACITVLAGMLLVIHDLGGFVFLGELAGTGARASVVALCALGLVIIATIIVRAIKRYESDRTKAEAPFSQLVKSTCGWFASFAVCGLALCYFAPPQIVFAAACGFLAFIAIVALRQLDLGRWVNAGIAAVMIGATLVIAASASTPGDLTLRFAVRGYESLVPVVERIIRDTAWLGSGAGAFPSLLMIYGDVDSAVAGALGPSAASVISIEMGKPAFWAVCALMIASIVLLVRGAMQRGRDSFYPAAGAACGIILMIESFCDPSLFTTTVIVNAAAILGIGLGQSVGRTVR